MDQDPRRLIARLAVAVMTADGRITPAEREALSRLDDLGLGQISGFAEAEIARAMQAPLDVETTCAALAGAGPEASAVIVAALAEIAASDRDLAPREIEALRVIGMHLGLDDSTVAHIADAAMRANGAPVRETPRPADPAFRPVGRAAPAPRPIAPQLEQAYRILGISPASSVAAVDAAYLALVERYNPAKLVDLGAEFAALAARKLAEATSAFDCVRTGQRAP